MGAIKEPEPPEKFLLEKFQHFSHFFHVNHEEIMNID